MFDFLKKTRMQIDYNTIDNNECKNVVEKLYEKKVSNLINKKVYDELEIFEDYNGNNKNSIFSKINRTETYFGEVYLKLILKEPSIFYKKYKRLDKIFLKNIEDSLKFVRKNQKCLISCLRPVELIYDNIYVNDIVLKTIKVDELNFLVQKAYTLFNIFLPIYNILSPIIFLVLFFLFKKILPKFFVDKFRYLINISMMGLMELNIFKIDSFYSLVKTSVSLLFFVYNIYSSLKFSAMTYILYNNIYDKLNILNTIFDKVSKLYEIKDFGYNKIKKLQLEPNKNFNYGYIMLHYKRLVQSKEIIECSRYIGLIDYHLGLDRLIEDGFSIPNYIKSCKPKIIFNGVMNPYFSNNFVKNNINISDNLIITGPNACGKSTFIKTVLLNLILAQTVGICNAEFMLFTPFTYITSSINNVDSKGEVSLFQNEIKRIENYIKKIESTDGFCFSVIDEIFSGTNNSDAEKAADIFCNKLSRYDNNISLITTHLENVTKKRNKFKNYKMLIKNTNRKLEYLYKIEEGINKDSVFEYLV